LKSFFVGCEGGGSDLCATRLITLRPTLRRGIGDESLVLAVVGGIFLNGFLAGIFGGNVLEIRTRRSVD
jgi:hypothetical protein